MRILFFVATFPSFSETFVLNQVTGLIDAGHDVRIYSWGKGDKSNHSDIADYNLLDKTYYQVLDIPQFFPRRLIKILPYIIKSFFKYGTKVFNLLSKRYGHIAKNLVLYYTSMRFSSLEWTPDVIITHFGDNGLMIDAIKEAGLIPLHIQNYVFIHAHEICKLDINQAREVYAPMFKSNDFLLPISNYWKEKLLKSGCVSNRIETFHMGIDPSKFNFRSIDFTDHNELRILTVGRLVGQKGYPYALEGVANFIKTSQHKVKYTIIGGGPEEKELKERAKILGIEDFVVFTGAQPQQEVIKAMNDADIFLLPSITDEQGFMEGIPVALMEAMATGLLCVSTIHSGIPELIINDKTGFLCREKSSDDITNVLLNIYNSPQDKLMAIAKEARNYVEKEFNVKLQIEKLERIISQSNA